MNVGPRVLVVADDRHVEHELRQALRLVVSRGETPTVLTSDALLTMRLVRERIDARLTTDCVAPDAIKPLDSIALAAITAALGERVRSPRDPKGGGLARYLEYCLIPPFMRAVRHVAVLDDLDRSTDFIRRVVVGSGPLAQAARHVFGAKRVQWEAHGAGLWRRLRQTMERLYAGRHVRWVGTEFRSLVLEPGFLLILYARGLWIRLTLTQPLISRQALIVTGDRWTAEIIKRLDDTSQTVILAGATQPGREQFRGEGRFVPIETFARTSDALKAFGSFFAAFRKASDAVRAPVDPDRFVVNGLSFWPLVAGTLRLHLIVWLPLLRHLRSLVRRVSRRCPEAALLTSSDAPAYAAVLIAAAREFGIPSTTIQHGLMGEANGHAVVRADTIAAWGSATEPWHQQHATQTAHFVVTGYPGFDGLAVRRQKPGAAHERPTADRAFTVVVCTGFILDFSVSASDSANLTMLEGVLDWARVHDTVRVVLKMHPGEEPAHYEIAAAALGWKSDRFSMTNKPILHDLLESSDVLVTCYSSTALESVMLGTPAIVCDFAQRNLIDVGRVPGVTIAYSTSALHQQLQRSRDSEKPDRRILADSPELSEYVFTIDGNAAERVAALVAGHQSPAAHRRSEASWTPGAQERRAER